MIIHVFLVCFLLFGFLPTLQQDMEPLVCTYDTESIHTRLYIVVLKDTPKLHASLVTF
jgi:hypothetical protein